MLTRIVLVLLLLLPSAAVAQELDAAVSALVRISGTRDGAPVRGSGFVVGLGPDWATIVTASHVIEGIQQIQVTFSADATQSFPAGSTLGMDAGNPNGLAVFQIRGALPAGITVLSFEGEQQPHPGDILLVLGFSQMETAPRLTQRMLSAWRGALLLIDLASGEGFSGGPVLQRGKVVGVVTGTDDQTTYAVSAVVARVSMEGWRVSLGMKSGTPVTTSPAKPVPEPEARTQPNHESSIDWLGLQLEDLTAELRQGRHIPSSLHGVVVTDVPPTSPLYEQLVRPGDIITEVNGEEKPTVGDFEKAVKNARPRSYLRFYVLRTGPGDKTTPFFAVVGVPQ